MKSTFFFLALVATLALVSSWCPLDYCDKVECTELTAENCAGKIVTKGSTCGCCDSCVHVLEPGQNCLGLLLLGVAPTVACPDGYFCDSKTISCQPRTN